jgi:hypothetical protein
MKIMTFALALFAALALVAMPVAEACGPGKTETSCSEKSDCEKSAACDTARKSCKDESTDWVGLLADLPDDESQTEVAAVDSEDCACPGK